MVYTKQVWSDFPETSSPLSAARLNYMEEGIRAGNESSAGLVGTTPPSAAPTAIGIIYTRTTTGEAWRSVGTSSVADWKPLSASADFDIFHEANANLIRPAQAGRANWYGTVEPANWIDGDRWYYYSTDNTTTPPASIPTDYVHRYEALDHTFNGIDGQNITSWASRTGGTQLIGYGGVTLRTTNGPVRLVFDGVDDRMDAAIAPIAQPYTKVVLARYVTAASSKVLVGGTSGSSNIAIASTGKVSMTNGTTLFHTANVDTAWHLYTSLSNGNTSSIAVGDSVVTGPAGTGPQNELRLAANGGLTSYSNVEIAFVMIYPRALTTAEVASIASYAAANYQGSI